MDARIRKFAVAILVVMFLAAGATQGSPALSQSLTASSTNGRIAFVSYRDGNYEIYIMNPDGSDQTRLTNNLVSDWNPSWSPDSSQIAFESWGGDRGIYVMNADGSEVTRLTSNQDYMPDWSPDGSKIAFESTRDGNGEIYMMNADGSGQTRLTDNLECDLGPDWSPDGSKIAFHSDRDASYHIGDYEIYVMNADGTGVTRLTNNPLYDMFPSWSPDGNKIAFTSDRGSNYEIYVMSADGLGRTNLTNRPGGDMWPTWSPDGSKIAFMGGNEIYVMNADGSGQTNLTNAWNGRPDWGPGEEVTPMPTPIPTTQPTVQPTSSPTPQPTAQPTATTTPRPTSTPSAGDIHLNVPLLRQNEGSWATDVYNGYTPDKVSDTIARWGCATTSVAMVLNYYGASSGAQTTPKILDDWLAASSGYTPEHGVIWSRVTWFAWDKMGLTLAQPVYVGVTVSRLDNALAQGIPPIVNVGGHFVVVTGKVGGKYTINDPLTNGHETLDQYQFWGSMIAYASASGPTAPSLWLYLCSPAEMVVMDSLGRQTGIDPTTGDEFSEIPGAFYGDEFLSPADDSDGATMHAKVLVLPEGGIYTVEVTGTGEGSYTLLAISSGDGGQPFSQSITRSVSSGQVDSYVLDYSPADGSLELTQNTYLPLVLR